MKLRILLVSHYALPHVGGVETGIAAVAEELARRGHELTHLASAALREGELGTGASAAGRGDRGGAPAYRVVRVGAANWLETRLGVPYPLFSPRLVPALRAEVARADVVHAHGFLYQSSVVALALARRAGHRPVRVLTEHVGHVPYPSRALDLVERGAVATLGRAAARSAQAVVTYNDRVARELRALAPGAMVARIPNGVDPDRYRPPGAGERERLRDALGWDGRPRVLFVGRRVARKGLAAALRAAAVADGAFRLAVAGPGLEVPSGAAHVDVLGGVAPARLAELYRAADAFVLPSAGEGFPLSAQEAMASGLPVVLARDPAYEAALAGAGPGARLVEPEPGALAAEITDLLADAEARAAAGEDAVSHARAAFSWPAAADRHERLYAELGAGVRRAPEPDPGARRGRGGA